MSYGGPSKLFQPLPLPIIIKKNSVKLFTTVLIHVLQKVNSGHIIMAQGSACSGCCSSILPLLMNPSLKQSHESWGQNIEAVKFPGVD